MMQTNVLKNKIAMKDEEAPNVNPGTNETEQDDGEMIRGLTRDRDEGCYISSIRGN
jgi:hypothetical protein